MSRTAAEVIADARLYISDVQGLAIENSRAIQILSYRYQTWYEKLGRRVTVYSALFSGLSNFTAGTTSKTSTAKDIEEFLSIQLESSNTGTSGLEIEIDSVDNVLRLQNIASAQAATPHLVSVMQLADSASPGAWQIRTWPIPDGNPAYHLSAKVKKRIPTLGDVNDPIDLPDVDTQRLGRVLAYDMGLVMSRPSSLLQELIADLPDEMKAAFGLSQSVLRPRVYPEKQEA